MEIAARDLVFDVSVGGPDGGEPVVLLHGFPQNHHEWDAVRPGLHAAGLRTVAVNQRGYSPQARPPSVSDYRIDECALDVIEIARVLGYDSMHVVGHDWGSLCAWHLACTHPGAVRTLTAISVAHPLAINEALATSEDQRSRSAYIKLFRQEGKAEQVLLADDARRLRDLFGGIRKADELYVTPMREPGALTSALNWYRAMNRADAERLGPVAVPTTYIWSDGDTAIGPVAAYACQKYVSGEYRFVQLAGITHWIPDQAPAAVVDAIIDRVGA